MGKVARLFSVLVMGSLITFLFEGQALAVKAIGTASIELVPPTTINQKASMSFKGIDLPKKGESDVIVASHRGSAGENASMGEYTISASRENSVQIDVKNISKSADGIKVSNFTGSYNGREVSFPAKNQSAVKGASNLKLGATLTVASDAEAGPHNREILIAFNYE